MKMLRRLNKLFIFFDLLLFFFFFFMLLRLWRHLILVLVLELVLIILQRWLHFLLLNLYGLLVLLLDEFFALFDKAHAKLPFTVHLFGNIINPLDLLLHLELPDLPVLHIWVNLLYILSLIFFYLASFFGRNRFKLSFFLVVKYAVILLWRHHSLQVVHGSYFESLVMFLLVFWKVLELFTFSFARWIIFLHVFYKFHLFMYLVIIK